MKHNDYGQPVGDALPDWVGATMPEAAVLEGRFCRLAPLDAQKHAPALFAAHQAMPDDSNWTYLPYEKPRTLPEMQAFLQMMADCERYVNFVIVSTETGEAVGTIALMRTDPVSGVLEIGHVNFSPLMQRSSISTEALFLLLSHVFNTLGFRRCEWKCDSLNASSRAAAERFGFVYEGTLRQAVVTKGRNRDTDWLSITDADWPAIHEAVTGWLDAGNFDGNGRQRQRLAAFFGKSGKVSGENA